MRNKLRERLKMIRGNWKQDEIFLYEDCGMKVEFKFKRDSSFKEKGINLEHD